MTVEPRTDAPDGRSGRSRRTRYRTTRLEAFSDGVFAIAITLLVLEISVPAGSQADLLGAIVAQWPSYLAYAVSFATVGAIWLSHNAITEHLSAVDSVFVRLNLLLLLVVAFLPFPTRLLAEYVDFEGAERVAVTIYGLTLLFASSMTAVLWRDASRSGLVVDSIADDDRRYLANRLTPGLVGYVAILAFGLLAPKAAVVGYLVIAFFFLAPIRSARPGPSEPHGGDNAVRPESNDPPAAPAGRHRIGSGGDDRIRTGE